MNYKLITAYSVEVFEALVAAALAEGWSLSGGVAISHGHPVGVGHKTEYAHFAQALTKPAEPVITTVTETIAPPAVVASAPKKKFGIF